MTILPLFMLLQAAQPAGPTEPAFKTQGAFFAVSVADVDVSARWYAEKFGMKVVMQPPERGGTRMVALEGGGLLVELIDDSQAVPLRTAAPAIERDYRVHGIFKSGIVVEDWDRLVATLKARDVPIAIGPFAASTEQRANLIIRDNEGNYIQFFGDYAGR